MIVSGEVQRSAAPLDISKWAVVEVYRRVKADQGATGVDGQSIEEFEENLTLILQWAARSLFGSLISAQSANCGAADAICGAMRTGFARVSG